MLLVQRITLSSFCLFLSIAVTVKGGGGWLDRINSFLNPAYNDDEASSSQNDAGHIYGDPGTLIPSDGYGYATQANYYGSFAPGYPGHPPIDPFFKPYVDGFCFIKDKWVAPDGIPRTHIITHLAPLPSYFKAEFKLPELDQNESAFIQLWAASPGNRDRTSEIGLLKRKNSKDWTPLLFNTDDHYMTSWMGDYTPDGADKSSKRTVVKNSVKLESGDYVELVAELSPNQIEVWVNDKYIGKIIINYAIGFFDFGFEMIGHVDKRFDLLSIKQFIYQSSN